MQKNADNSGWIRSYTDGSRYTFLCFHSNTNAERVSTIGGIYGTITSIKDDTLELSVGRDNVKLIFARWAIRQVEDVAIENDSEVLN